MVLASPSVGGDPGPTVTFSAAGGRVAVAGRISRWLDLAADAAEARATDGWLVPVGTAEWPVAVALPQHPHGKRMYSVQRIEVRLCDGLVKCPAGPPAVYALR